MIRTACILLLVLTASVVAHGDDEEAITKFSERTTKTNNGVADAHVNLARWCLKVGLNINANAQLQRALKLVPEHKKAMKELGYKQKRVKGKSTWVLDERRVPPKVDAENVSADNRKKFLTERDKLHEVAAEEYVKLAKYAKKLGLEAHARVAFEWGVTYDPQNEAALAGAGWIRDELGDWISPEVAAERLLTEQVLSETPEAASVAKLPDWTARAFPGSEPLGTKFGAVEIFASGGNTEEFGQFAWGASKLTAELLGGKVGVLRVVAAANDTEHKAYCKTRHPGMDGLSGDNWVLGEKEVEVLLDDEDDRLGLERIVYAVAVFEARRRCGESTHPWFEVAFASNLTRRLLGRVTTAEFSGDAEGPVESGRWKRTLRQLAYSDTLPDLGKVIVARDPNEHQVIFAHFFVRYLCAERHGALPAFCAAMKSSEDDEDALKTGFEQDAAEMQTLFADWFARN